MVSVTDNMNRVRARLALCTLALALVMTATIMAVFMDWRQGDAPSRSALAPVAMTHTVYLPLIYMRSDTIYGIEMTAVSDGAGLELMRNAGNTWVHLAGIWWPQIEPTEGNYNWSQMAFHEQNFRNAQNSNMKVVVVVRGTPDWAQKNPPWACGPITQTKLAAFGEFMYQLVQRYSVAPYNVMHWELVNEPDVDPLWIPGKYNSLLGCWGDQTKPYYDGEYYAEMLKVVYPRMKEANPVAQVLIGGLLLDCDPRLPLGSSTSGCNTMERQRAPKFFEGILRGGGGSYFDGVSFHAYDYFNAPGVVGTYSNTNWLAASNTNGSVIFAKAGFLQAVMAQYGVSGKYLMNTEIALLCPRPYTWCDGAQTDQPRINFEQTKAYLIAEMYPQAIISGFRNVMWFRNKDEGIGTMSMLNDDLTPRPAYTAFLQSRLMLGEATYVRALTSTADIGTVSNVRGYSFKLPDGRTVWTVWSLNGTTKVLTLPGQPAQAVNQLGATMVVSANNQLRLFPPYNLFSYVIWNP